MSQQKIELPTVVEKKGGELLAYLQSELTERSSFRQIRVVAKQAIELGMIKGAEEKKDWCLSSLESIQQVNELSLKMQRVILAAIEVICLSRRVSNLRTLGVFSKKINGASNHAWLINGARLALTVYFPELPILYIKGQVGKEDLSPVVAHIKANETTWVVIGYHKGFHLSLMRVINKNQNLQFELFDSLGAIPSKSNNQNIIPFFLYFLMDELRLALNLEKIEVHGFVKNRQQDSANCFSVLLHDLSTMLTLIRDKREHLIIPAVDAQNVSYESNIIMKEFGSVPEFHRISQVQTRYPSEFPQWTTPIRFGKSLLGNPLALTTSASVLAKLVKAGKVTFVNANHQEEGESEEDEEIGNCVIQ